MTPFKMAFTSNHQFQAMSSRSAANAHGRPNSALEDRIAHCVPRQMPRQEANSRHFMSSRSASVKSLTTVSFAKRCLRIRAIFACVAS